MRRLVYALVFRKPPKTGFLTSRPININALGLAVSDKKISMWKTCDTHLNKLYSNKNITSDFHGIVSFDPIKMSQQKIGQNVYQTSDTQNLVIICFFSSYREELLNLKWKQLIPLSSASWSSKRGNFTLNGNQERPTMKKHLKISNVLIKRATLQFKTVN